MELSQLSRVPTEVQQKIFYPTNEADLAAIYLAYGEGFVATTARNIFMKRLPTRPGFFEITSLDDCDLLLNAFGDLISDTYTMVKLIKPVFSLSDAQRLYDMLEFQMVNIKVLEIDTSNHGVNGNLYPIFTLASLKSRLEIFELNCSFNGDVDEGFWREALSDFKPNEHRRFLKIGYSYRRSDISHKNFFNTFNKEKHFITFVPLFE